jgi:type VII secretion integral membrane protein EccD
MAKVAFPARCAVAVVCGEHLISQVYPASVPVEAFLDDIVELLGDELKLRGVGELESGVGYELHKANGVRLDVNRTLDELGVEDGATLVLVPAGDGDSFEPQYESVSTGLARIGKRLFEPVSVKTAAHTAVAILGMTAVTVLGLTLRHRGATDDFSAKVIAATAGLLIAGGAAVIWRWWPQIADLICGFAWLATPLLASALAIAAPGNLGWAHVFIAALTGAVMCCGIVMVTGRLVAVGATAVTVCALCAANATVRMWAPVPAQWLGMATLVTLLVLLTVAPTIALWCARIRPPHFGSITGRDLFRRGDGLPVDAVEPVSVADDAVEAGEPTVTGGTLRGAEIAAAAVRANSVLTGICCGAGLALPVAVWATVTPGRDRGVASAVLAGLFVLIFISRGRAYTDKYQAVYLVCGAAAAMCAGVTRFVVAEPAEAAAPLAWAAVMLAGFAGGALLAGLLVPVTKFTPLVRMAAEWLELVAIIAALPLAAWIGGVFTWVRMR